MRLSFSLALATALASASLGHAAPTAPQPTLSQGSGPDGLNLPQVTAIGDTLVGGTLTLQMENTAFSPLEVYLIGTTPFGVPIPLGSQGNLYFLWDVVLPGNPSQTTVAGVPPNPGLIGLPLLIQGLGLVIEGQVGELRLSDLVVVPLLSPAPENLSYSVNPASYLQGQAIAANVPTVTWKPDLYEVTPDLPNGLVLNPTTGVLSGTPNEAAPSTVYTVTASNSQGETTVGLTFIVDPKAPTTFEYTEDPAVYTTADTVSNAPLVDSFIDSFSVTPPLSPGLVLDPVTGVISGQPTQLTSTTIYTVTATNVSGSIQTALTVTVNPAPPTGLEYSDKWIVYAAGAGITPNVPSVVTEVVDSYSVTPPLPPGLNLNINTGVITGVPAAASSPQALTVYTITATNVSGSDQTTVEIVIDTLPPPVLSADAGSEPNGTISYTLTGTLDVAITEVLAVDILRELPPTFQPGTGLVYLNPTSPTYQEFDGDGSSTWTFEVPNDPGLIGISFYGQATGFVFFGVAGGVRISNVTETVISLPAPTNLVYPVADATYLTDEAITPNTPTVTGFVQTWSINPPLPAGLSLSQVDGSISGTPTETTDQVTYTVTASNTEGGVNAMIDIRVIDGFFPQFAFATNGGDSTLSAYSVDGETGQLRHLSYAQTGNTPTAVAATPDGQYVYTADALAGTITGYALDGATGQLSLTGPTLTGTLPFGLEIDETGNYLYAVCAAGADGIYAYRIEANGALTPIAGSPFGAGTVPNDVATRGNVIATCSANTVDSVETYTINPVTGTLTMVSSLSTGQSPRGVEFSADGAFVYVANQNGNSVSGYSIDGSGALTELAQSPFDVLIAGGDGPEDVAASKDGFLYTANVFNGTVTGFSIALDGSLIPLGSTVTGNATRAVTIDSQGKRLYAVNEGDNDLDIFDIGGAGTLTPASPARSVRGRPAPNAFSLVSGLFPLEYDSDRAYISAQNENRVYEYEISATTGAVTQLGTPEVTLPQPGGVVVHPAQLNVYVSALSFPGVGTYNVLGNGALVGVPPGETTGQAPWSTAWESSGRYAYTSLANPTGGVQQLTRQGNGTVAAGAISAAGATSRRGAVDPTGRFYYVPNEGANTISQYLINESTGALTALLPASVATSAGPVSLAIDPSGRFLYSVASGADILDVFSVGGTGGLSPVTSVVMQGGGAVDIAVEPQGRFLYVAFEDTDELEIYSIAGTTGIPTELAGGLSPAATDDQPVFVVVDAPGDFLYVVHRGVTPQVRAYSLNAVTGQLNPGLPVPTGAGAREMAINTKLQIGN